MTKLNFLQLSECYITKIQNVGTLCNLELLDLGHNKITHIEGIEGLNSLEDLWVLYY